MYWWFNFWLFFKEKCRHLNGAKNTDGGARTRDPGLKRPMLYQLSYTGVIFGLEGLVVSIFWTFSYESYLNFGN